MESFETAPKTKLEQLETLEAILADSLDKEVSLVYHQYGKNYGLALEDDTMLIDGNLEDQAEESALLTDLYNEYKKEFTLDSAPDLKYKISDEKKRPFLLKDFIADMRASFEEK